MFGHGKFGVHNGKLEEPIAKTLIIKPRLRCRPQHLSHKHSQRMVNRPTETFLTAVRNEVAARAYISFFSVFVQVFLWKGPALLRHFQQRADQSSPSRKLWKWTSMHSTLHCTPRMHWSYTEESNVQLSLTGVTNLPPKTLLSCIRFLCNCHRELRICLLLTSTFIRLVTFTSPISLSSPSFPTSNVTKSGIV